MTADHLHGIRAALRKLQAEGAAEIWARDSDLPPPEPIRWCGKTLWPDVIARFEAPTEGGVAVVGVRPGGGSSAHEDYGKVHTDWVLVRVEDDETFRNPARETAWRDLGEYARATGAALWIAVHRGRLPGSLQWRVEAEAKRLGLEDARIVDY